MCWDCLFSLPFLYAWSSFITQTICCSFLKCECELFYSYYNEHHLSSHSIDWVLGPEARSDRETTDSVFIFLAVVLGHSVGSFHAPGCCAPDSGHSLSSTCSCFLSFLDCWVGPFGLYSKWVTCLKSCLILTYATEPELSTSSTGKSLVTSRHVQNWVKSIGK
jgi:hypothetical protein